MPSPDNAPDAARPLVAVLVGPTAVGKTAAAIALAEHLPVEIVSADSRYLYRGLDIGTAKPTLAEQAAVPHHLIDVTTPDQPWSLSQFQEAANTALAAIVGRGHLPVLVGGTGQYVRAVVEGWQPPPGDPTGAIRADLEAELAASGLPALVERLRAVDPASAAQIDLRNPRRVVRALEVATLTGASFVAQRLRTPPPYRFVWLGLTLPRPELYARLDARIDAMLAAGLVAEVQGLARRGYGWELPAMSGLGYKQIGAYLRGESDLSAAVQALRRDTRQFVRRQANWFRLTDPAIRWFPAHPGVAAELAAHLALPAV
jgi:tRNA dimethylallyltransferase